MQKRRVITVVIGVVLCLGAIAPAQDLPRVLVRGDSVFREEPGHTDFAGNARLTVDGVMVEADRIVARVTELKELRGMTPLPSANQR